MIKNILALFLCLGTSQWLYSTGSTCRKIKIINTTKETMSLSILAKGTSEKETGWGGAESFLGNSCHIIFSEDPESQKIELGPHSVHTALLILPKEAMSHLHYNWGISRDPLNTFPVPNGDQPAVLITKDRSIWKEWDSIKDHFKPI